MSWEVSGTYLGSDVIQVTICKDDLNCENAFSTSLAIGDVNFVYSGSNTTDDSMYYITVEICNEASFVQHQRRPVCLWKKERPFKNSASLTPLWQSMITSL